MNRHPVQRLDAVLLLAVIIIFGAHNFADGQTPSEQSLPGQKSSASENELPGRSKNSTENQLPGQKPNKLPSESTLPKTELLQEQLPKTGQPLPSESELPGLDENDVPPHEDQIPAIKDSATNVAFQKPSQKGLLDEALEGSRDNTPWLRLVESEHTAPINTIAFSGASNKVFSAGDDKVVLSWERRDGQRWFYNNTLRWQVQRAERGVIRSIDEANGRLAIGGTSAEGQFGEIAIIDHQRELWLPPAVSPDNGHRFEIQQLHWVGEDLKRIAAIDAAGGVAVWSEQAAGNWSPNWLRRSSLTIKRRRPLAVLGRKTIVWQADQLAADKTWKLQAINIDSAAVVKEFNPSPAKAELEAALTRTIAEFESLLRSKNVRSDRATIVEALSDVGNLVSIHGSKIGGFVIASDDLGFMYVWDKDGKLLLKNRCDFATPFAYIDFAIHEPSKRLYSLAISADETQSKLEYWQLMSPTSVKFERSTSYQQRLISLEIDPTGRTLAIGVDRVVHTIQIETPEKLQRLPQRTTIESVASVQFANELPYRWKAMLKNTDDSRASASVAFDGSNMNWMSTDATTWQKPTSPKDGFQRAGLRIAKENDLYVVLKDGQLWTIFPDIVDPSTLGLEQSLVVSWCCDVAKSLREQTPILIAISTIAQNDIGVYSIDPITRKCELTRVFRGHESRIRSLDCSPDFKYLISGASDCSIRLWSLRDVLLSGLDLSLNRWGCRFEVIDDEVQVTDSSMAGPLYYRGLRDGDIITEVSWEKRLDGGKTERIAFADAQAIVDFLNTAPLDTAVRIIYSRGSAKELGFQAYPHWREIAAQVIAIDREWAMWTPNGIYDASFNGNTLFGWQVNRGMFQSPDFYRADRFQSVLERPDVMKQLLISGSVDAAMLELSNNRQGMNNVLQNAIALTPRIEIRSPERDALVNGESVTVSADIFFSAGQTIDKTVAYANGVPAKVIEFSEPIALSDGYQMIRAEFNLQLPSDEKLLVNVFASNQERFVGAAEITVYRSDIGNRVENPIHQMLIVSAGVSRYRDSRIPSLNHGSKNAESFANALTDATKGLYDTRKVIALDAEVNRASWRTIQREMTDAISKFGPDDLIVLYLSGHGIADEETGEYYFVAANAKYRDIQLQNYVDCLSFADIAVWKDAPCRKIVVLDTCHSGMVQTLERERLKQAVRALQSDFVLTLTATEGNQLAAEYVGDQASVFTNAIVSVLQSRNDENQDGVLDWPEVTRQVSTSVIDRSKSTKVPQFPTAGPRELLEYLNLPIRMFSNN